MTAKTPYILVRMICGNAEWLGREFNLIVEQRARESVGVRAVPVLPSPYLKHGRLLRPGAAAPDRPPLGDESLKNFRFDEAYAGCPYCQGKAGLMCNCGTISCASQLSFIAFPKCPGCGDRNLAVKVNWLAADVNNRG